MDDEEMDHLAKTIYEAGLGLRWEQLKESEQESWRIRARAAVKQLKNEGWMPLVRPRVKWFRYP